MTLQERYEQLVDEFTGVDGVTPPEGGSGFGRGTTACSQPVRMLQISAISLGTGG